MADKYLIQGAAFCGNGLASNEAASAGAAGAWNNINVLTGTAPAQGTLAAGDRVFIRSKTSGGADVAVAVGATTLGAASAVATEASPIDWYIDAGSVWAGVSGLVRFTSSGGNNAFTLRDYNNFFAVNGNLSLFHSYADFGHATAFNSGNGVTDGLEIELAAFTTNYGGYLVFKTGVHRNLKIRARRRYQGILKFANGSTVVFYNPQIELLDASQTAAVFDTQDAYGCDINVFGGKLFGAGAAEGVPVCYSASNASSIDFHGFAYPRVMPLMAPGVNNQVHFAANGVDGVLGSAYANRYFQYDSRDDGYYPTLSAILETSTSAPWSYKLYPANVTRQAPAQVSLSKLNAIDDLAYALTLEFLWPTAMAAPTRDRVFMQVTYTTAAGTLVSETTRLSAATAVDTSSALWSATTYGPTLFTKRKLSLTTASAVKKDTSVLVSFFCSLKSGTSNDVIFIDPDPTMVEA